MLSTTINVEGLTNSQLAFFQVNGFVGPFPGNVVDLLFVSKLIFQTHSD